jgi:hypothetical protein
MRIKYCVEIFMVIKKFTAMNSVKEKLSAQTEEKLCRKMTQSRTQFQGDLISHVSLFIASVPPPPHLFLQTTVNVGQFHSPTTYSSARNKEEICETKQRFTLFGVGLKNINMLLLIVNVSLFP